MFLPTDLEAPVCAPIKGLPLQTSHGRAWVVSSAADLPAWLKLVSFASASKDFSYYQLIEDTLPGQFEYRYFVLENAVTGEQAIQPFFFVDQDLAAGLPKRFTKLLLALRAKWPRLLRMRMLMVGCAAGEGELASGEPWVGEALHEVLDAYLPRVSVSMVLLKDFYATHREALSVFAQKGYRRVPSMPAATLALASNSFEVYMQHRLSKVYRKSLRRKFRDLDGVPAISLEVVTSGADLAEELHALYLQTHLRSNLRFERLTPEYFAGIGERMPDKVRFFLWRQSGRLIAFSLCLVHEETIYDLAVGFDYAVALDLHLYFVTLRDVFDWAVVNGHTRYYTGPLNYDPKLHLKMQLSPLDLYARHLTWWINPFFKLALQYLEPTRHDPIIRKFPNAHELV